MQAPVTARSVDPAIPVNTEAPPVSSMELAPLECVVSSVVTSTSTTSTSLPLAPVSGVLSCHSGQSTVAPLSTTSVAGATVLKVVSALDGGVAIPSSSVAEEQISVVNPAPVSSVDGSASTEPAVLPLVSSASSVISSDQVAVSEPRVHRGSRSRARSRHTSPAARVRSRSPVGAGDLSSSDMDYDTSDEHLGVDDDDADSYSREFINSLGAALPDDVSPNLANDSMDSTLSTFPPNFPCPTQDRRTFNDGPEALASEELGRLASYFASFIPPTEESAPSSGAD